MSTRPPSTAYDTMAGFGIVPLVVGAGDVGIAFRALHCNITTPGVATLKFVDGSIMNDLNLAVAGPFVFNYVIVAVQAFTGVGTFYGVL